MLAPGPQALRVAAPSLTQDAQYEQWILPAARRDALPVHVAPLGATTGGVRTLLRAEGLVVLAAALVAYQQVGASWSAFALLFLLPDLSMLGYLRGPRVGALLYNAAHSYVGPAASIGLGALAAQPVVLAIGLVWAAHIGFDRMLGYGLKYSGGFGTTHLGRIGRRDAW